MQVYILDPRYELLGVISEQEDIVFSKRFNDVGYCALKVACDEEMLSLLKCGNYIYRYDDDMICKIETPVIDTSVQDGDYLTVTATDMNSILAGRIVRWEVVYSGTVAGFIKRLIVENIINPAQPLRKIENFEFDDSNFSEFTETINVAKDETAAQDLLKLITTTCKTYNYGFRVSYDIERGKLVFRLIRGKNKATTDSGEYVEFSPNYANIISSHYKEDESGYKNIVYVGYKTATEETALLSLHNEAAEPRGEARREIYVDGSSTSRDITIDELEQMYGALVSEAYEKTEDGTTVKGNHYYSNGTLVATSVITTRTEGEEEIEEENITVSDYTYLLLLRRVGLDALASAAKTMEFSGKVDTVDTYKYKIDYDLGDIVKVKDDYGIEAAARIIEVTESENAESPYTVEPVFEYIY